MKAFATPTDLIALAAIWAMVAAMFGVSGAWCFILAQLPVFALVVMSQRVARPVTALLFVSMAAACGAPLAAALLEARWPIVAPLMGVLLLGAPGLVLHTIASVLVGRDRADSARLLWLGPLLVAMAFGGKFGGLAGTAAIVVVVTLAAPFALLLAPGTHGAVRFSMALHALGVLAAALVACLATAAAMRFGDAGVLAAAPSVAIGLVAGFAALRVHAPAAIARLKFTMPARAHASNDSAQPRRA